MVCGFFVSRHAPPLLQRAPAISMGGVSDRMANDGLLYDGWGAEGMRILNSTASLQEVCEAKEISRYDAVLIALSAYHARTAWKSYVSHRRRGPGAARRSRLQTR